MKKILFYLKSILAAPLYIIFLLKDKNNILTDELREWENTLPVIKHKNRFIAFIRMFAIFREYRSLFLYRLGGFGELLKYFIPCMSNLHFVTSSDKIGKGLVIQHGFSTIIWPESMGTNCQIWQNVTIGRSRPGEGRPTIGNNVKICTSAIVLGKIYIGNNVTIGASSVVLKNVPDNCVVCGNPARIVKLNGKKANITL